MAITEYAIQNRLTPFISMQNFHNAMYREVSAVRRGGKDSLADLGLGDKRSAR